MKGLKKYFLLFLLITSIKINATHIVGGEIIYDDLGGGKYRIILKVYRDCGPNILAQFDGLVDNNGDTAVGYITIREVLTNSLIGTPHIGYPLITVIPKTINNPCIQTPNDVCVQEGVYTLTVTLPPKIGGYTITYQRCCRNNSILNLIQPGNQGASYFAKIPGSEVVLTNSSPRYKNFPPIFICNNVEFIFDHSAIDPDGDQLVYTLCPPFLGADPCCASLNISPPINTSAGCPIIPVSCPTEAPPPPYSNVNYASGFSGSYPIASSSAFTINPTTGILIGTPNLIGQFVVCVCVQEFRNGVLIDTHFRDFQFNVKPCVVTVVANLPNQLQKCIGLTINFSNASVNTSTNQVYHWDFGVTTISSDTSNIKSPTYIYQDTGTYLVTLIANPGQLCTDTVKKLIYVYPPLKVNFLPNLKQCLINNNFNFFGQGIYAPSAVSFNWNFTAAATPSTATTLTINNVVYSQAGLYFVKLLAKQYACRDSFIDSVRVIGRPKAQINNLGTSLCNPAKVAFTNGSQSELPLSYLWQFSNGNTSTAFEPTQVFTPSGIYGVTLTVKTTSLCVDTSITSVSNITVNPTPYAGFTFSPQVTSIFDPDIYFYNTASGDVINWNYTFGDGTGTGYASQVHTYTEYGDYLVTQIVNNQYGCYDTLKQTVKILPEFRFWIPNCFTPDDNLLNDTFMPLTIGLTNYEFDIFDRWGEKIFTTKNPKQGWNGLYKGKECKQDIYVWRISFKNVVSEKDEIHYGHVTLLRNL